MFGGNSNWRGPVWMPVNYLFINAFKTFGFFYNEDLKVECPTHSGKFLTLSQVAKEITSRLLHIFDKDENNERLVNRAYKWFYNKEENKYLILFHENFHGDDLYGLGASHQTGWTALIANLILDLKEEQDEDEGE
jgi:hydroxymethylpyrimidine pyrophosphatase-like HAD family hydrolase